MYLGERTRELYIQGFNLLAGYVGTATIPLRCNSGFRIAKGYPHYL